MRFSRRLIKVTDLRWCSEILEDGFEYHPNLKSKLPQIWAALLLENACTMIVVTDDINRRPVAFAASGIVSDRFAEQLRQSHEPHAALAVMQRETTDDPRHILRPDEIKRLNHPGHGVNLMIFHYSEVVAGYQREQVRVIRDTSLQGLMELQSGYALKEVIFQFYGETDLPYTKSMGLNLRKDYAEYQPKPACQTPDKDKHPFLVGLTAGEVENSWGTSIAALFSYSRPYLFFTAAQQSVLIRALLKYSDSEIANDLALSDWTVKDHWKTIFERVVNAQVEWPLHLRIFPDKSALGPSKATGKQRNKLLQYLAQHPSELRPVDRKYFVRAAACCE